MIEIGKLLEFIKLSPRYYFVISLVSAILLFSSTSLLSVFGLNQFANDYRMWIGVIFLISFLLLFAHAITTLWKSICRWYRDRQLFKTYRKSLQCLTPEEKRILASYLLLNTKSQRLDFTDGVVNGLEHSKIIYQSSNVFKLSPGPPYNIQPWAWEELKDNPALLEPVLSQMRKKAI